MKKKITLLSLFFLVLLPITMLLSGCMETFGRVSDEFCCYSPMAAVPFLLLAVFQLRKE
jgi:hypothetical protein